MDLLSEYRWRGLLHDATEGAAEAFAAEKRTAYIGFDPTADSLHVGSLLPIMGLVHLQRCGHTPIALVGGGTGLIGDPSGKGQERPLLSKEMAERNREGIRAQLEHFLDFEVKTNPAQLLDNLDWLGELRALDFMRDVGKHFTMNVLLRKETVRRRLDSEEQGISYTEFSYILLQAYDFLELYDRTGCTAQLGGSDQWGNITAGIDLIRRVRGARAYGAVFPLIVSASGTKFGKTEAGTVWLDPERTSPYRFYQYWFNTEDADALRYLRFFTLLDRARIEEVEAQQGERPHERAAQRALAEDVTRRVHGETGLARALAATEVLFGGSIEGLDADDIADVFGDVPSSECRRTDLEGGGTGIVDVLATSGATASKGEARRAVQGGGVYLNNQRVTGVDRVVSLDDAIGGRFVVLRLGKKRYHLLRVVG